MTTKVKITAEVHQADRQVKVEITNSNQQTAIYLNGNESTEAYVYETQTITVSEVVKGPEPQTEG